MRLPRSNAVDPRWSLSSAGAGRGRVEVNLDRALEDLTTALGAAGIGVQGESGHLA